MASGTGISLIAGLGNPGNEYADTRHNAGFRFLDRLLEGRGMALRSEGRFSGRVARVELAGREVWLLAPETFMNHSGEAVGRLARFYKIPVNEILVAHDELDLAPGAVRLKVGGGDGGHNGLKDITSHLGTQDYWRLRIGIGHPGDRNEVVNYVLKPPRREEQADIDIAIERALDLMPLIEKDDWNAAIQRANTKPAPPKI